MANRYYVYDTIYEVLVGDEDGYATFDEATDALIECEFGGDEDSFEAFGGLNGDFYTITTERPW